MKKLNENQLQNLEGGKRFLGTGWTDWSCNYVGANQCHCTRVYTILWVIQNGDPDINLVTADGNGGCPDIN